MKISRKALVALITVFVLLAGAIFVFANSDYGKNLMGRMTRGISKFTKSSTPKEAWWCAKGGSTSTGSEPVGETSDQQESSSGTSSRPPIKISEDWAFKPSRFIKDFEKFDTGIPVVTQDEEDGISGASDFDLPEVNPGGSTEEGGGATDIHCMCDGEFKDFSVPNEDLSKLYDGSIEVFCEAAADFEICQPHEDLACVCTDPENPNIYSILTDTLNNQYGGDKQAYCDEMISPIYCKSKYLTCKWGFDHDKVGGICEDTYKAMKQAECNGSNYKADPGIIEVCKDANMDMPYLLEASCPTQDECEEYLEMFNKGMTCAALNDYLKSIGVDSGVSYTCHAFFGIDLPLGGKGCGE